MAICKMCHKQIQDGKDFCPECESKRLNQADESYLDSLLSSVSENTPAVSRNTASFGVKKDLVPDSFAVNEEIIYEDLDDTSSENTEEPVVYEEKEPEMDSMISDLLSVMDSSEESDEPDQPAMEEDDLSDIFAQAEAEHNSENAFSEDNASDKEDLFATISEEIAQREDIIPEEDITLGDEIIPEEDIVPEDNAAAEEENTAEEATIPEEAAALEEDPAPEEETAPEDETVPEDIVPEDIVPEDDVTLEEAGSSEDSDNASPFDEISLDDTINPFDNSDLIGSDIETIDIDNEDLDEIEPIEDTKDIFLGEEDLENSLLQADPNIDSLLDDIETGEFEKQVEKLKTPKKVKKTKPPREKGLKGLFKSLFYNIEYTPEEIQATKDKEEKQKEDEAIKAANKKRKAEESKEEKAQKKEEKRAENEEKKKQASALKAQKKKEAEEKARKKKEEKLALQSIEVDEGKINRTGATILFVLFSIITVFIIIGTNIYSYNLSMERAENDFNIRHYNEAYYDIYGLTIRNNEEDKKLSDKIMTVMYVNTQLNSYKYYMTSNNREKALNSLLKGLQRYDKYNELAGTLEIEDDFNYIRGCILTELKTEFDISENEAYSMIDIDDSVDYSEYIYELLGTYEVSLSD